jgi:hypothetical protein
MLQPTTSITQVDGAHAGLTPSATVGIELVVAGRLAAGTTTAHKLRAAAPGQAAARVSAHGSGRARRS